MAVASRSLIVLAGPIHPAGHELLEAEARVVVCEDLTEPGVVRAAEEADGILFRNRPPVRESLQGEKPRILANADLWPRLGHLR